MNLLKMVPEPEPPALVSCGIALLPCDGEHGEVSAIRSCLRIEGYATISVDLSAVNWVTSQGLETLAELLADGSMPYVKFLTLRSGTSLVTQLETICNQRDIRVNYN